MTISPTTSGDLIARAPLPKPTTVEMPESENILTIKFRDDLKVRAVDRDLTSLAEGDLSAVEAVQTEYELTFEQRISLPQEALDSIEDTAAARSGRAQPDLAGIVVVQGDEEAMEDAAQALLTLNEVEWVQFSLAEGGLPCDLGECCDVDPTTPLFFEERCDPEEPECLIFDYHGDDPGLNMICAWGESYNATGQGIIVADCDGGYSDGDHEDLCNIIPEEGQPGSINGSARQHSQGVLGIMFAEDNEYGWTGLIPDATGMHFANYTDDFPSPIVRVEQAVTNAIGAVELGDVVVIEWETSGGYGVGPAELDMAIWTLTRCATDAGKIVVAAAGNGGTDLDGQYSCEDCSDCPDRWGCWGDSSAIIVGGGHADTNHERFGGTFGSTYGSRVNVQGWYENIFTVGLNSYWGDDPGQGYNSMFGGTSGATPMVASSVAALQSYVDAHLLDSEDEPCRLSPCRMRQLLIDTGHAQGCPSPPCPHIGPFPDVCAALEQVDAWIADPPDCNTNGISDICDLANCEEAWCRDCNCNNTLDGCDIAATTSQDVNTNGTPDECEPMVQVVEACAYHGSYDLCLDLPQGASGAPYAVEPRKWVSTDTQRFRIVFTRETASAVSVSTSCTDSSTPVPTSVVLATPRTLDVAYSPPLPNTECCTLTLTGGVSDTVEIRPLFGDVDQNGAVNTADKNLVNAEIGTFAYTSPVFWYDVDKNNAINAADKNLVNAEIGQALDENCSLGGGDSPGGEPIGTLALELWPVGGDGPVTTLAPDTPYEVHYATDADCVNAYTLFAVAECADQGIAAGDAPSAGDWSATGNFRFIDLVGEWGAPTPAPGYGEGHFRYQMIADGLPTPEDPDAAACAGSAGRLCTITTQAAGDLNLHLYLAGVDEAGHFLADLETTVQYLVEGPSNE